jgi:hypothetical protein
MPEQINYGSPSNFLLEVVHLHYKSSWLFRNGNLEFVQVAPLEVITLTTSVYS